MHKILLKLIFVLIAIFFSIKSFSQKKLYAGIEIGSKGIKMSVIDVKNIKKGNYEVVAFWTENVGIAKGISIDGKLIKEDISRAGLVVSEQIQKINSEFGVLVENIFVVGSSGVAMASNTDELRDEIKKTTNKELDFIDADTEGKMLLKGAIPPKYYKDSMILDIGGGNTKGGYVDDQNNYKFEFFPLNLEYGTITLTEAINKTITIRSQVDDINVYKEKSFYYTPVLREKIKEMLNSKPLSLNKNNIYMSGGAVWAFVTLYYDKKDTDNFVSLELEDIINYDAILKNNFAKYENLATENKAMGKVLKTYNQRYLISANNILISCLESIPDLKKKKIYFAKQGQIAWLVSYVVDRSNKVKRKF